MRRCWLSSCSYVMSLKTGVSVQLYLPCNTDSALAGSEWVRAHACAEGQQIKLPAAAGLPLIPAVCHPQTAACTDLKCPGASASYLTCLGSGASLLGWWFGRFCTLFHDPCSIFCFNISNFYLQLARMSGFYPFWPGSLTLAGSQLRWFAQGPGRFKIQLYARR